jgi:hypothetical protein
MAEGSRPWSVDLVQARRTFSSLASPPYASLPTPNPKYVTLSFKAHYYYPRIINMASRATSSRTGSTTSNVRRNLFHHHLSRRPASVSTSTSATTLETSSDANNSDIVSRDKDGNYEVETQTIPPIGEEQQESEREKIKQDKRMFTAPPGAGETLLTMIVQRLRRASLRLCTRVEIARAGRLGSHRVRTRTAAR